MDPAKYGPRLTDLDMMVYVGIDRVEAEISFGVSKLHALGWSGLSCLPTKTKITLITITKFQPSLQGKVELKIVVRW